MRPAAEPGFPIRLPAPESHLTYRPQPSLACGQFEQSIVGMEQAIKQAEEQTRRQPVGVVPAQATYQCEP